MASTALLLASLCSPSVAAEPSSLAAWLRERRSEVPFNLAPGLALAVVSEYGARTEFVTDGVQNLKTGPATSERTLFEVGSVSKTLVALALATLVDEGVLHWDVKVADVLGTDFGFGPDDYVRRSLSLRDLLSHRSGLAEDQGGFLQALQPSAILPARLRHIVPSLGFRESFSYSNTGWELAGEMLRAAANASSWCDALTSRFLLPMGMNSTFCDRNSVPLSADAEVAAVHKVAPCEGLHNKSKAFRHPEIKSPHVKTYAMVRTGLPGSFAWGAADAAGSVLSSAADMARMMALLLGGAAPNPEQSAFQVVRPSTLREMLSAQMVVPESWAAGCGILGWSTAPQAGQALAAGLGFDIVGQFPSSAAARVLQGAAYAEKSGDTDMHKARLGLLPDLGIGVMLMSNLGGEVGDQLTALKFGALALAAGASKEEANDALEQAMQSTQFWDHHFDPASTCTLCGTALVDSSFCSPGGVSKPPLDIETLEGTFGDDFHGHILSLLHGPDSLEVQLGPISAALAFGPKHSVLQDSCSNLAKKLQVQGGESIARQQGNCTLVEFRVPRELADAGISEENGTIAFPWGCGIVPLPTAMPIYIISASVGSAAFAWLPTADVLLPRLHSSNSEADPTSHVSANVI